MSAIIYDFFRKCKTRTLLNKSTCTLSAFHPIDIDIISCLFPPIQGAGAGAQWRPFSYGGRIFSRHSARDARGESSTGCVYMDWVGGGGEVDGRLTILLYGPSLIARVSLRLVGNVP